MKLKILVTGTGRCGTNFVANLLTSIGLPCGHEAFFGPKGIDFAMEAISDKQKPENSEISKRGEILSDGMKLVADSSYMAAPFIGEFDCPVIHVVRNPIEVISSFLSKPFLYFMSPHPTMPEYRFVYEEFIYKHLPELAQKMPKSDRAALYYIRWNEMIEHSGRVELRHRIEDSPSAIVELIGHSGDFYFNSRCNSFSLDKKRWNPNRIKDHRIKKDLMDIMKRYGYPKSMF